MDEATRRVVDGKTWEDFCDALKAAGSVVVGPTAPADPLTRAEGWRYLSRLLRLAFETFLEGGDSLAPVLRRPVHETVKIGMDNPDNVYLSAPISGDHEYRIRGSRGTVHYLGFGTQKGNYGATGSLNTTGYLEAKELDIESDGSFEIAVSTREQSGNWLPMNADSTLLIVRQTRLDHASETLAELQVERTDGPNQPRLLDPAHVDRALQGSVGFVRGCSELFARWATDFEKHVNSLPRFDPEVATAAGGDPNIAYYHSYWKLGPGEALVIEVTPPACDYWNFQLSNHWLESLDYRYFRIHVNNHTARTRDDGSVRVVVAHEDPGVDDWLDTCGHDHGTMCWRWVGASEHPQPRTRVLKLSELANG